MGGRKNAIACLTSVKYPCSTNEELALFLTVVGQDPLLRSSKTVTALSKL